MIAEEWAQLPGWPYEVSTEGQDRRGDKPVKVSYAAGKYPKFTGSRPGQRKTIYLPDAMWTAHVEPTDLGRVTFADGNPKNVVLANLIFINGTQRLMPEGLRQRAEPIDRTANHGRFKPRVMCSKGHRLSMTAQPDRNTEIWAYGNRICLACERGERPLYYPYNCVDYD